MKNFSLGFMIAFLCGCVVTVATIVTINYVIDTMRNGFSRERSNPEAHALEGFRQTISNKRPETLLIGSSHVRDGFSDTYLEPLGISRLFRGALNLHNFAYCLPGLTAEQGVRRYIIGLDFFVFNEAGTPYRNFEACKNEGIQYFWELSHSDLLIDNILWLINRHSNDSWLLSRPATKAELSLSSIRHDADRYLVAYPEGTRKNFLRNLHRIMVVQYRIGVEKTFRVKSSITVYSSKLEALRKILNDANSANINIDFIIHPSHAYTLESYWAMGIWDEYENWKRELTKIIDNYKSNKNNNVEFRLFDFGEYNIYTKENLPPISIPSVEMLYHYDPTHYRPEIGQEIIRTIEGKQVKDQIGVRLTVSTIEERLSLIRKSRAQFAIDNPIAISEVSSMARHLRLYPHLYWATSEIDTQTNEHRHADPVGRSVR